MKNQGSRARPPICRRLHEAVLVDKSRPVSRCSSRCLSNYGKATEILDLTLGLRTLGLRRAAREAPILAMSNCRFKVRRTPTAAAA